MTTEFVPERGFKRWLQANDPETWYVKLMFVGFRGAPDRLVCGEGFHFLIEWKRKDKKPKGLQLLVHNILIRAGFRVYICYTKEEAINIYETEKETHSKKSQ